MKLRWPVWLIAICLTGIMTAVPACSSSDSDDDSDKSSSTEPVNIKGTHTGTRSNTNGSANISLNFKQSGSMLSGSIHDGSLGNGVISGNVDGDDVEFTTAMNSGGVIVEWVGEAAEDGAKMSGTWSMLTGGTASGDWSVAR
ncbi:MAG: hypothetical protein M5U15_07595 [Kiritimatiellae bacterium]|nr:hypothetical protein [Kiritimatiellia bacterium]